MTILEIMLTLFCVTQTAALIWLIYMLYKTGLVVLAVQDTLEESLEVIDDRIESINEILAIPLFSDSPEIKRLQSDMTASRDAILEVAYALSNSMAKEDTSTEVQT